VDESVTETDPDTRADRLGALARAKRLLTHPRLPLAVAVMAVALSLPALNLGLQLDDNILSVALMDPPPAANWSRGPSDVFAFFTGDAAETRRYLDAGLIPWWTHPDFRIAFFRPLAGLTHWIDFRLWPSHPWLMHVHSLLWFGAAVAAAAVFFRRFIGPTWVAGLASVLYALDDAHGAPAAWLANRNASIASCFGVLALLAHDNWRRTGSRRSLMMSIGALVLALLGGELGVATSAYVFAYAVCLDTGTWRGRMASLFPAAAVCAAWVCVYLTFGFGAAGSGLYVDPAHPRAFAAAVVERAPVLLFGQWLLPADIYALLSPSAARLFWLVACALVGLVAIAFGPLLRRDPVARFFGLGMLLAVIPACGTFPSGRLLILVGLGGMGLLAQFVAGRLHHASWLPQSTGWRRLAAAAFWIFVAIDLVLAPVALTQMAANMKALDDPVRAAAATLPTDAAIAGQTAVIVNTPGFFVSTFSPMINLLEQRPIPARMLVLASGVHAMRLGRPASNVLVIRPDGGFLAPPGGASPGEKPARAAFDLRYVFEHVDRLYRDATPFRVGDRTELSGLVIEITAITGDGRPAEVTYHFATGLDDPSRRWLQWIDGGYVPFRMPGVGEAIDLPPASVRSAGLWGR
jgi:hypothetical protein